MPQASKIKWTEIAAEVLSELLGDLGNDLEKLVRHVPSAHDLALVLEAVFWASLRKYEGVPTKTRIYLAPRQPLESDIRTVAFDTDLTEDSIRKLSPAHGREGGLVVRAVEEGLRVAGICVRHDAQHPPPLLLCTESTKPGVVRVSSHMLSNFVEIDRLEVRTTDKIERDFARWPVAMAFQANLPGQRWVRLTEVASLFIEVAEAIERSGNGGAIWMLHEGHAGLHQLASHGYRVSMDASWCEPFREEWENRTTTLRMVTTPVIDDEAKLYKIQECTQAWDQSRKSLTAGAVAALARTDGAIVASAKPEVVAFGVVFNEFDKTTPRIVDAGPRVDPFEQATEVAFEKIGGSRHQSAARFCSTFAPASAIVASHDGGLTAFLSMARGEVARRRIPKIRH